MAMQIQIPSGETYVLRQPRPEDAEMICDAVLESQEELAPWMPWCHANYGIGDTQVWIEECIKERECGEGFPYIIVEAAKSICIGACGLHRIDKQNRSADLGYWVRNSQTGQGIAAAAAKAVAVSAFRDLDFVRLEIVVVVGNEKSEGVAKKIGANYDCLLRNGMMHGDKILDASLYSLIPEDLEHC